MLNVFFFFFFFFFVFFFQVDENFEGSEFCLQLCSGKAISKDSSNVSFHQAYVGPNTSHLVKHLRSGTVYSFRVNCRPDSESDWCIWSVPRQAVTNLPHYREFLVKLILILQTPRRQHYKKKIVFLFCFFIFFFLRERK